MTTALCIMGGVILLAILVIIVLAVALMMAVEQINLQQSQDLEVPPIKWDYSAEQGWVDAEVREVSHE